VILFLIIGKSYLFPDGREGNFIAVLPLKNISSDAEQEWFIEGMTDALITDLAQISGLRVISSSTAMKYKGTNKTPPEIAAELSVQYLVELSSVKMGDQLKVSARLINAPDDEYIWAKNYDRNLAEVLVLFSEAAQDIASEIKTELTLEDLDQFANVRPVNPKAYELYLKGNYHLNNTGYAAKVTAADYFKKAIELDSTYALAYVGLGVCYGLFTYLGKVLREDGIAKIKNYTKKALEIDENLAEAYYNQGAFRLWQLWDWEGSGKAFNRAISLNPNVLGILKAEYPWYLMAMGRFKDAIVEAERLLERDPLSPVARLGAAQAYFHARQYDKAIELYQRTIELDPEESSPYWELAINYEMLGQYDDAHKSRLSAMKLSGIEPERIAIFDSLYTELGSKAYPTWRLMEKKDWFDNNPTQVAGIYTQLGEKDKALEWLEKAYKQREGALATLNTNPMWDALKGESRFQDLLKRMNFPN